jgi:prepilin-type N-terminal cleavage/methylation domain-containing protein
MTRNPSCPASGHPATPRVVRGFSLVELLTAMVISSLLMFALFSLVGRSGTNYRLSQRKITTISDTRAFLQFIQNDLSTRVADTKFFWKANPNGSHEFAFIRAHDPEAMPDEGDLSAVLYYVAFTADGKKSGSQKIFRRLLDGAQTQKLIEAGAQAAFPARDPATDDAVVYNVVRFQVKPLQRDAAGNLQNWVETSATAPSLLEVTLDITDDFSAQRLVTEKTWLDLAQSTDIKKREAVRRFVQNVPLTP